MARFSHSPFISHKVSIFKPFLILWQFQYPVPIIRIQMIRITRIFIYQSKKGFLQCKNVRLLQRMLNLHSITTNYCISAAWHGGSELVALLSCHYSRSCFDSSLQVVCMCFFIFLLTVLCRFSEGFRSGKLAAQSDALIRWSENHSVVVLALWTGAEACWKRKLASW